MMACAVDFWPKILAAGCLPTIWLNLVANSGNSIPDPAWGLYFSTKAQS
jgi:hypothetical protein